MSDRPSPTAGEPDPRYGGARVWFRRGQVDVVPLRTAPTGALPAQASVVSAGTELRQLRETGNGPDKPAGYMNLARVDGELLLAPVPHGAWLAPWQPGAVRTGASLRVAAVGRFQLMAALGLRWLPDVADPLVVGTGPVALGCVLELLRRGAETVRVLTDRADCALARLPEVRLVTEVPADSAGIVIEASGRRMHDAVTAVAPTGVLGILGTPDPATSLPALTLHRKGIRLIGMHELVALDPVRYQHSYSEVTGWLAGWIDPALLDAWCLLVPGEKAADLYRDLGGGNRPTQPVLILGWTG